MLRYSAASRSLLEDYSSTLEKLDAVLPTFEGKGVFARGVLDTLVGFGLGVYQAEIEVTPTASNKSIHKWIPSTIMDKGNHFIYPYPI